MGLILPIGRWVIEEVTHQINLWINSQLIDEFIPVSVNLSMRQLKADDLVENIRNILEQTKVPAGCLELEVTESIMMEDPITTIDILKNLHALGVKLTIDDFGTGYSSLSYLRQMPLDCLKIDKSFISDIGCSTQNETIIKAITALSHNLNLKVVAEGVENDTQLEFLKQLKCDYIQGFYYGKPMNHLKMSKILSDDKLLKNSKNGEKK